jgi:hypothetical protein
MVAWIEIEPCRGLDGGYTLEAVVYRLTASHSYPLRYLGGHRRQMMLGYTIRLNVS